MKFGLKPQCTIACLMGMAAAGKLFLIGAEPIQAAVPPVATNPPADRLLAGHSEQMAFSNLTINEKPVFFALDTANSGSCLTQPGAHRLGLNTSPPLPDLINGQTKILSLLEDVRLQAGQQFFTGRLPVLPADFLPGDGFIGWPDIKDNLLIFDAARHTVRAVEKLPPETDGWLKLKILPAGMLTLEVTLADGTPGALVVDTGMPLGVGLPHAQWKAWKASHPQAPTNTLTLLTIGRVNNTREQAWADEIKIGGLTLTDVPVYDEDSEVYSVTTAHWAGALGLYALSRMDLVVDDKSGFAYLKPKPAPGPPYPELERAGHNQGLAGNANWRTDGSVRLNIARMQARSLYVQGELKQSQGNSAGALRDFSQALELDPKDVEVYLARGEIRMYGKDFENALADYNRVVEMYPNLTEGYLKRCLIKMLKSDYAGALPDIDRILELDPQNVFGYTARAWLNVFKGEWEAVINDCDRILALDPQNAQACYDRGFARLRLGDNDGVIADMDRVLAIDPNYENAANAYSLRGQAKLNKSNYASALVDYDHAISLDSKNPSNYSGRGAVKYSLGDFAGALADYDKLSRLVPANAMVFAIKSNIEQIQGDFMAALADGDQAIKLQPEQMEYARLARYLLQLRLHKPQDDLTQPAAHWKDERLRATGLFLAGGLEEAALLAVAQKGDPAVIPGQLCETYYYLGMKRMLRGDRVGAGEFFKKSIATGEATRYEFQLSRAELARLEQVDAQ